MTIIIGMSSGIAAFKILELIKILRKEKHKVIVVMTKHTKEMLGKKDFVKATSNKVAYELFPKGFDYKKILKQREVEHISLADRANVICIAPATANIIAKLAGGIADDLLTTTVLASKARLILCPSMNVNMWENKTTKENIKKLKEKGYYIVEPENGMLACGYKGKGRLAPTERIFKEIQGQLKNASQLSGKRVIVSAGGTEEPIDDVRIITNRSSGKMGVCIAEECQRRGADVTMICGRMSVLPNCHIKSIFTPSADEMYAAIKNHSIDADILFHAAAVSDFKVKKFKGKISSKKNIKLTLTVRKKIIDEVKKWNPHITLVGFKAATNELVKKAMALRMSSSADIVVANDFKKGAIGGDFNQVTILNRKDKIRKTRNLKKEDIARIIVDEATKKCRQ